MPTLLSPVQPAAPDSKTILAICRRIVRGKAAESNRSVLLHSLLRLGSIFLSSLGGVGVVVDKASSHLANESGWAFWGSVILLAFGILSQIANEFRVAERAANSKLIAAKCRLYETQLENILELGGTEEMARDVLRELSDQFIKEPINAILPEMTNELELTAEKLKDRLEKLVGPSTMPRESVAKEKKPKAKALKQDVQLLPNPPKSGENQ